MSIFSELADVLSQLARVLSSAGDRKWRHYIEDCRSKILDQKFSGVEKLLAAYVGTMGSFNDVCGSTESDHARLQVLRDRAYELAASIKAQRSG